MDELLAPDTAKVIVPGISAVVVAIITYVVGPVVVQRLRRPPPPGQPREPGRLLYAALAGITAAVTFFGLWLAYDALAPRPSVAITSPAAGQQIEVTILPDTGAGLFIVTGTSTEVFAEPDLRVYVLVHPADPFASGWWIQHPATVDRNGRWSTQAWIGSTDFPPHQGDRIDLLVIAAGPDAVAGRTQVSDPKDLGPAAQSDIVQVSIGTLR